MAQSTEFVIHNDLPDPLMLDIEPEGVFFSLGHGEEVSVSDVYTSAPVTIKVTTSGQGWPILSIWPGDGEVRVEKDGVDVFDLIQQQSVSTPDFRVHLTPPEASIPTGPPRG